MLVIRWCSARSLWALKLTIPLRTTDFYIFLRKVLFWGMIFWEMAYNPAHYHKSSTVIDHVLLIADLLKKKWLFDGMIIDIQMSIFWMTALCSRSLQRTDIRLVRFPINPVTFQIKSSLNCLGIPCHPLQIRILNSSIINGNSMLI